MIASILQHPVPSLQVQLFTNTALNQEAEIFYEVVQAKDALAVAVRVTQLAQALLAPLSERAGDIPWSAFGGNESA